MAPFPAVRRGRVSGPRQSLPRGHAPWRGAKLNLYEGGTRVAAALKWPAQGLSGGKNFEGRIGYLDILPTLVQAAGQTPPKDLDGLNFLPALQGKSTIKKRPWFSYLHQSPKASSSLHLDSWKLIVNGDAFHSDNLTFELFNLESDPGETSNLAEKHPDRVSNMLSQIKEFGKLQVPGATPYGHGREGFTAPKDWIVK